ncbi:MAG: hypothetical protein C4B59_06850 [Candidatus Methanogaster sp.]|uniref:Uncharacterized protein n=1 Tax=Candidatus Methanogaster sp. TaxID=3386292 RepID=A0AC61L3E0_9EURY|nr:MAG: hypothetical protein C4B59_06850 [ANME-2 cluster archaeon]
MVGDQHLFDQGAAIHKFTMPETGMSMSFAVPEREKMTPAIHLMNVRAKQVDLESLEPRSRVIERRKSCSEDYR